MAVVKVVSPQKHSCKLLMVNCVKPSQGKSNQLPHGVKVVAKVAKIAGLGYEQSWQRVNLAGVVREIKFSGNQIKSDKFTYCHLCSDRGEKKFCVATTPNSLRDGWERLDTLMTHNFLAAPRDRILRFEVSTLNLE